MPEAREFFLQDLIYSFAVFVLKQRPNMMLSAKNRPWCVFMYEVWKELKEKFPELKKIFESFDWDGPYPENTNLKQMLVWMRSVGYFYYYPEPSSNTIIPHPDRGFMDVPEELLQEMLKIALRDWPIEDRLFVPRP